MRPRSRVYHPLLATATLATTALLASACSQSLPESPDMGGATPVASPAAENPAGTIIALPVGQDEVTDMEVAEGDILGLRTAEAFSVGTVTDFEAGDQQVLSVDKLCGDLTATGGTFLLPCPEGVYRVDAAQPSLDDLHETEGAATAAALTSAGELLVGSDDAETMTVYRDGQEPVTFDVADPTTQMISVPVNDRHDAVVRTYNSNTTIQDIDYPNDRMGATLRVGLGVAQIAGGEDGLLVVSDAMANQLAIYNADDIIRLQMTTPVDDNPWGVAWDAPNALAWITSLSNNQLVGYRISDGVPEEQQRLDTVADAQNLVVLEDSTLIVVSASGDGLQVIDNPAV